MAELEDRLVALALCVLLLRLDAALATAELWGLLTAEAAPEARLTLFVAEAGATFVPAAAAVAAALSFSATSRNCKGHISVFPLVHDAATEDCTVWL